MDLSSGLGGPIDGTYPSRFTCKFLQFAPECGNIWVEEVLWLNLPRTFNGSSAPNP